MTILYNPKRGARIHDTFQQKKYVLEINELKKFDDIIADYLLKKYGFLRSVKPEEVVKIRKEMESKAFKCKFCDAEFTDEKELKGHELGKHKLTKEAEAILESIPSAEPVGEVRPVTRKALTPEQIEGVPTSGTEDRDGVIWVGEGLEKDIPTGMESRVPGITKGVFGAS